MRKRPNGPHKNINSRSMYVDPPCREFFVRGLGFVVALLVHLGIDFYVCLLGVNPAVVVFKFLSIGQSVSRQI